MKWVHLSIDLPSSAPCWMSSTWPRTGKLGRCHGGGPSPDLLPLRLTMKTESRHGLLTWPCTNNGCHTVPAQHGLSIAFLPVRNAYAIQPQVSPSTPRLVNKTCCCKARLLRIMICGLQCLCSMKVLNLNSILKVHRRRHGSTAIEGPPGFYCPCSTSLLASF